MKTQESTLQSARGHARQVSIDAPAGLASASALFVHELPPEAAQELVACMVARGLAVVSMSARQATEQAPFGADDLIALRDFAEEQLGAPAQLLVGHGLPGTLLLVRSEDLPSARAIALIHAPSSLAAWMSAKVHAEPAAIRVQIADRPPLYLTNGLAEELSDASVKAGALSFHGSVLLAYAPLNPMLSPEHATALFTTVKHSRSFLALDHSGHDLEHSGDRRHLVEVLTAWMSQYISVKPRVSVELGDAQVVVRTERAHYHTDINAAGHALVADEPESAGGTDHGPGPYEYLQAALGACTAITVRMYADRKEIPLDAISVNLTHEKVAAEGGGKIDSFTRGLVLEGELSDEQRERLKEIADKCPVHKTLTGGQIKIDTKLV
jgi:putative redox protein